ncbi:MAG TPA: hypothetical protein VMR41_00185 [Patescibacteria group bacterium]|nr:hypothetical protein [Patescibacteria group bacterium]
MNKTILQIPMTTQLKNNAESIASEQGFSSLQEVVRVFLTKFAAKKVEITWQEPIYLSEHNEKRYIDMSEDFKNNKNVYSVNSVTDLVKELNENKVS